MILEVTQIKTESETKQNQESLCFDSLLRAACGKGWIAKHLKQEAFCSVTWYYLTNTHFFPSHCLDREPVKGFSQRSEQFSHYHRYRGLSAGITEKNAHYEAAVMLNKKTLGLLCQPNSQAGFPKGHR